MDILNKVLLILHHVGFAALFGSVFFQLKPMFRGEGRMVQGMLHGGLTALVTGIIMMFTVPGVNHVVVSIKLLLLVLALVLVLMYIKKPKAPTWALAGVGVLSLINIAMAVFGLH